MKLLIATGLYPPEIGGPATYTKLLEEKLPPRGYVVSVLPFSKSRHLPKIVRHLHYSFLLFKAARSTDMLYAQDTVSVGLPTSLVAMVLQKPYVVRVPGDYAWEQSVQRFGVTDSIDEFQMSKQPWRARLLQRVQAFVTGHAALVITPSKYFQTLVGGWGVQSEKNITIYNGVDLQIVPKIVTKPEAKLLVTAGRLVEWKGIDELIALMVELPDWHLVIVGDGPERTALEQLAETKQVHDRITFTGSISREEVFGWCTIANAFVLNTYFESFSYQIVEAMHSGAPVITTNVGSLPELITHGKEGVLVDPGNMEAIKNYLLETEHNPAVWQHRTKQAQEKVSNFTIDVCLQKLDVQLKQLV